ncbi:hypothetical protein MNBD_BACTEROID05-251 [hydrothermal vent metagenome]|uniref:AsmA-like C-terminal domain-containing protein n=1 Tax=hydrothermal vent metagenome TaxID=652676 RepID=A0A3B0SYA0_9ZZZZ
MLSAVALLYINNILLPIKLKRFIEHEAQTYLKRQVTIGKMQFTPFKGFVLQDIRVARKDDRKKPFIEIQSVHFNILLTSLLKSKQVIIPALHINNPYIFLAQNKSDTWNFSDIITKFQDTRNVSKKYTFLMRKLVLKNGELSFLDQTHPDSFQENIDQINLTISVRLDKSIRYNTEFRLAKESFVNSDGTYFLETKRLNSHWNTNYLRLSRYIPFFNNFSALTWEKGDLTQAEFDLEFQPKYLQLIGNSLITNPDFSWKENKIRSKHIRLNDFRLALNNSQWEISGHIEAPESTIRIPKNKILKGDLTANITQLTLSKDLFYLQSDIETANTLVNFDKTFHYEGTLKSSNFRINKSLDTFVLRGSFNSNKTKLSTSHDISVKGTLSSVETHLSIKKGLLSLQSNLSLNEGNILTKNGTKITGNFSAKKFTLTKENKTIRISSPLEISIGKIILNDQRKISTDLKTENLKLILNENNSVNLETKLALSNSDIRFDKIRNFKGSPKINLTYAYEPKNNIHEYQALIEFENAELSQINFLQKISKIKGNFQLSNDTLFSPGISFHSKEIDATLQGTLTSFTNPIVDVQLTSINTDIQNITALFSKILKPYNIEATGKAIIEGKYKGSILSFEKENLRLKANINDAQITAKALPKPITSLRGDISYKDDLLSWTNLKGNYQNTNYLTTGQIKNFFRPILTGSLKTDKINLTTETKILNRAIRILNVKGNYLQSTYNFLGDIKFPEDTAPVFDLRGNLRLNTDDLSTLSSQTKKIIDDYSLKGEFATEVLFRGILKDWLNWQLVLKAKTANFSIKDYPLKNIALDIELRDKFLNTLDLTGSLYDGNFNIKSSANVNDPNTPFKIKAILKDLNLSKLRKDGKIKRPYLSGKLSLETFLEGPLRNKEDWIGEGIVLIKEGYLGQLIPQISEAIFTEASSQFNIAEQRIFTKNTQIHSSALSLSCKGWINFDKEIYFDITPILDTPTINSENIKIDPSIFFTKAFSVSLSGTLDNPVKKVNASPKKLLKNTTDILKEGLGTILQELF